MFDLMHKTDPTLENKWAPVLEGISDGYTRRVTAQLLENQAKALIQERLNEDITNATTTTGQLGTNMKWAFPIVRRVWPKLIANQLVGVQPMQGPVSQVFYLGHSRARKGGASPADIQTVYSKYNLTYRNLTASAIGNAAPVGSSPGGSFQTDTGIGTGLGLDGDTVLTNGGFDLSNVLNTASGSGQIFGAGAASGTFGGRIAAWPNSSSVLGFTVSAGERLTGTGIPEVTLHIEQEAVVSRTRKMRALWTLEASQDLKAYHNIDLEREVTSLLSQEIELEVDRELIEDLRMLAYGLRGKDLGGLNQNYMDNRYIDVGSQGTSFAGINSADATGVFVPAQFTYDFNGANGTSNSVEFGSVTDTANIFVHDFTTTALGLAPRHVGEAYANLLALINLASQDIYRTTMRGPGNWILTSPLVCSILESAAKLEGGIQQGDGPTNISKTGIQFKGKFMGRYDLFIDPMFPTDEIIMGYKGSSPMDAGFIYAPYIPIQTLPTVTDPETFQPRKGILTRYGKVAVEPMSKYYRVIRLVGPSASYLFQPFGKNNKVFNTNVF